MFCLVLLTLTCYISGVLSGLLGPCKKDDNECLRNTINEVFPKVLEGIPSRGVRSSDPLYLKSMEGNLSVLKFKFTNNTIVGYKNCAVKNSKLDVDALKLYFEMLCPCLNSVGDYDISGKLAALPVEGKGTYELTTSQYLIPVNAGLKIIKDDAGKIYVNIRNFELKPKILGPMEFKFDNLFNGQKDLSEAVHKFAYENYIEVAELVQDAIFNACVKAISKNINDFLKTEPLQEIFIK